METLTLKRIDRQELITLNPYFVDLQSDTQFDLARALMETRFERDSLIISEGQTGAGLAFMASGAAKWSKFSVDGKEQILSIIRPGDAFNDAPAFDGGPSSGDIVALSQTIVYMLSEADVMRFLGKADFSKNAAKVLAKRLREMIRLVEDLSFRRVTGRLARIILEELDGQAYLTQRDMAAMAGTAREVIGRSLKELEDEGIIKIENHRIIIKDRQGLREKVSLDDQE